MSILSVVERAYHGTLEEQDDTVLWFSHMVKNAGGDLAVLLRSNAVNYAVQGQNAEGLTIGGVSLSVPPTLDRDVEELVKSGVPVHVVQEDLADRGVGDGELVPGVRLVARSGVAALFSQHDSVWYW